MAHGNEHASCDSVEATLGGILSGLAVALSARRAAAFVVDDRTGTWRLAATHGLSDRDTRYVRRSTRATALTSAYWQQLAAAGRPVFVDAAAAATVLPAAWIRRLGIGAHLAVPLLAAEHGVRGCLALEMPEPSVEQTRLTDAVASVAATAIVNAYTARAQAEEAARNEALLEIVREVNSGAPLPDLLAAICRKTVQAFGLGQTTVFYHHRRVGAHVPFADYGSPAHVVERFIHSRYSLGNTPHLDEVAAGRTVVISRGRDLSPEDRLMLDTAELHTLAYLPLPVNDRTRGLLVAGIAAEQEFTPEQIQGLEVVAHHVATAISQARSLRTSEKAARFRAAVSALAVDLNAETSRAQALALLCARGRAIFQASMGTLLLATGDELSTEAIDGDVAVPPEKLSVPLTATDDPSARAFATGEVVLANDLARDHPAATLGLRSLLAIPVVGNEGLRGVLLVGDTRRRHFDPGVADEARVLGALAASTLCNLDLLTRLYETNAELRRVSSLKDQFLANVSHDLRTPLNIIIGYGQLALDGTFGRPPGELADIIARMVGSACEQLSLVDDLLDLSRIELDRLSVKSTTVPLAPLFAEMEFILASLVRDRPVRAVVQAVAPEVAVRVDRDRLRQILANLLGNAAKFTNAGTIDLRAEAKDDIVRIAVRDTGSGVAPADHDRIFEPFRQVDGEQSSLGAGLGLAIARRLSTLMGGTLTVESALGAGATFWLTLPAASIQTAATTRHSSTAAPPLLIRASAIPAEAVSSI